MPGIPARRIAPMVRWRQVAIARGAELGGVLVEGHVADVVKCLDGPVAADQGASWVGGAVGGQAGDRVDRLDRDLAGSAIHELRRKEFSAQVRAPAPELSS